MADNKGFTLLELSIVIVIMGLLVAAVMSGKELLNIAKLRSVISEIESYKIAVDNFKTQYEALPGDIKIASSFWTTAQNGGTAVANGNGDGMLGTYANAHLEKTEPYYIWNHLTLSKFIPGTFSGSSAVWAVPGTNVPASKYIEGLGFSILYSTPWSYADAVGRLFYANYIYVGKADATTSAVGSDAFLPSDALYIDSKIDDGTPDFGKVLGGHWYGTGSCTSGAAPDIIYNVSLNNAGCILVVAPE